VTAPAIRRQLAQPQGAQQREKQIRIYPDPLNYLRMELLSRHRTGATNEKIQLGIHLSINDIAAGLRNNG
jgi:phosphoenolpyruvate carboxylase